MLSSNRYKQFAEPEDARVGPAFPTTLDRYTIPPRFRTIVRNRVVPQYRLGWPISHEQCMEKYNPSREFNCNVNSVYVCKLSPEWREGLPEKWQRVAPRVTILTPEEKAHIPIEYILSITTNASEASLARAQDEEFMEPVQILVQMPGEPK